jgi:hypothetical protein
MKLTTDFKAAFKNSTNSEESINLIEKLTLTRHDLHVSLISDSTPESKLAAVDNYLPNILLLMNTLHSQDKITFDRTLTFEWKGTLHTDELYYKSAYITYEVLMVLHTKVFVCKLPDQLNNFINKIIKTNRPFFTATPQDISSIRTH